MGALNRAVKELQKSRKTEQSNIILEVMKKGIEPAYNFYKIDPQSIVRKGLHGNGSFGLLRTLYLVVGFCDFLPVRRSRPQHEKGQGEAGNIRPLGPERLSGLLPVGEFWRIE